MESKAASVISIFDPHLHLFNLDKGEYHWLKPNNPPLWNDKSLICRNFGLDDVMLQNDLTFSGCIHIEAGFNNNFPKRELDWLKPIFDSHESLRFGLIAYADITLSPKAFEQSIISLSKHKRFKGIRYIFDNNTNDLCSLENVFINLRYLASQHYIFELQFDVAQPSFTEKVYQLFCQLPELKVILNHAGFAPNYQSKAFDVWLLNMQKLASLPNFWLKCSGFEMIDRQYTLEHLTRVLGSCIDIYGKDKVMCASNFPLNLFTCTYQDYWQNVISALSTLKQINPSIYVEDMCGNNALSIYGLKY